MWLALSIASVVLAAVTCFQLSRILREDHTAMPMQTSLDAIPGSLLDTDTAHRTYTITRGEKFLGPVASGNGGVPKAPLVLASLTSLIAGFLGLGAGVIGLVLLRAMLGREEREKKLVEAELQAERNSQERSIFLANMSHEIRTPMNAILGFNELLEGELREPRHRQYSKSIRLSATSLLQIMNDMLDMSRIEAGVMELHLEPTDLRGVCEFVHAVFAESVLRKNLKLECNIAEDLPRALLVDRIRLRQILMNVVGNAINSTARGTIRVRVDWQKGNSRTHINLDVEVADTGTGIPPDRLDSIFKPFGRAGSHDEQESQGAGLGLAIVSRLTQAMGGTITARSVVGQGAVFHLRFPNIEVSTRVPASEERRLDKAGDLDDLDPAVVLVADDNEENRELMAGMFAGSRHKLEFATDGLEAVSKAQSLRPNLILLDIRMPGLDGRAALAQIRATPGLELVTVIAVTASALLDEEAGLRASFDGHLRKPFSKRELFAEVSQFLPRRGKAKTGVEPEVNTPFVVPASPELVAELHRLIAEEWPGIRDSFAINETRSFARKLENLAQHWPCPT